MCVREGVYVRVWCMEFEKTCRHAVKLDPTVPSSEEEAALAVGDVVGHDGVKSASA